MFERVSIKPVNGRRQTIYLEITKETDFFLVGTEFDKEGDKKDRKHIIDKSCITKRTSVTMNLHYGEFENA